MLKNKITKIKSTYIVQTADLTQLLHLRRIELSLSKGKRRISHTETHALYLKPYTFSALLIMRTIYS